MERRREGWRRILDRFRRSDRAARPPVRLFGREYFTSLRGTSFRRLALAVFVTFSAYGFLDDILILWSVPHWRAIPAAVLAGSIATVWLYVGTRGRK